MGRTELFLTLQRHQAAIESDADVTIANLNYDPCDEGPCRNGAECSSVFNILADEVSVVDSPGRVFSGARVEQAVECHCTEDYTGSFCEVHSCAANPCLNAGTCMSEPAGGATVCICSDAWTGEYCEVDVNECLNEPCQQGGTCTNLEGGYMCDCPLQFQGQYLLRRNVTF